MAAGVGAVVTADTAAVAAVAVADVAAVVATVAAASEFFGVFFFFFFLFLRSSSFFLRASAALEEGEEEAEEEDSSLPPPSSASSSPLKACSLLRRASLILARGIGGCVVAACSANSGIPSFLIFHVTKTEFWRARSFARCFVRASNLKDREIRVTRTVYTVGSFLP